MDKQTRPDFIIVGAMKCATSTIHDQLAFQPGISMSEPKEPNFFSDEEQWAKGMAWYESLFDAMPSEDLKGESSTHYTKLPTHLECAKRLHACVPDAKLIYVMRDPVNRIVSQYIHEWSQHGIEKNCSIDDAIRRYPMLMDYSRYAMQLNPYVELFGTESVLPVFFERWMVNPHQELERIAKHIGYSDDVRLVQNDVQNVSSQRQRMNPKLRAVFEFGPIKKARRTFMPESVRSKLRSLWTKNNRPVLSDESLAYLHEQLDPDLQCLGESLGVDLSCASFKQQVCAGDTPEWVKSVGAGHE